METTVVQGFRVGMKIQVSGAKSKISVGAPPGMPGQGKI